MWRRFRFLHRGFRLLPRGFRLACDAEIIRLITSPHHPPDGRRGDNRGGRGPDDTDGCWDATAQLARLLAAAIAGLPPTLAGPSAVLDTGRKSPGTIYRNGRPVTEHAGPAGTL